MFRSIVFRSLLPAVILFLMPSATNAQYVYLDANGDGVWTTADRMNPNGTPTTVDAWINTNHNRNGSLAGCNQADGNLGFWNSYAINLGTQNGTATFASFVNRQPNFNLTCVGVGVDFMSNSTEMTVCRATATSEAGGLKKMFTVTVTGQSGTPSLQYLPLGGLSPNPASFGTPCSGNDFDNTYKLGSDFFDNVGLGPAGGVSNIPPQINSPTTMAGLETSTITITATASDPDAADQVTLSQTSDASFLSGPATAGPSSHPGITLTGTPSFTQAGSYTISWRAVDSGLNPIASTATTSVQIANKDRAPVITAPATASGNEYTLITFTVTVSDPDGDAIASLTGHELPRGSTFTVNTSGTSGTFSWVPEAGQAGAYGPFFRATGSEIVFAGTTITVTSGAPPADRRPLVTAPVSVSGRVQTSISFVVSAADPDGDAIASLTASGSAVTAGATFAASSGNTSGTLSWTPGAGQAGSYSAIFTASNVLVGSAATTLAVAGGDQPPVVSAPATATGNENDAITYTVTASDPDAQPISSLSASSVPATTGSTFTVGAANTSGTFLWAPDLDQMGTYIVTVTATNALSGSAATTVMVGVDVDRAPVVTAPAVGSGNENTLITYTVSAADPDGEAITSLVMGSSPLAIGSVFTAGADNTSGTFSWRPTFTQAGTYTVTVAAKNAHTGAAATTITVTNVDRAPTITAPSTVFGDENTLITYTVSAVDPDGEAITSLTAASSPATTGSTFAASAGNTSGTFSWTPTPAQLGTYTVTVTATNTLSGSAATTLSVTSLGDRPPAVTAPATASGNENALITYTVLATDPDGQAITSLTAASSPATTGSTFAADAGNTSGTFAWTPTPAQVGTYTVTVTALNTLPGTAATTVRVMDSSNFVKNPSFETSATGWAGLDGATIQRVVGGHDGDYSLEIRGPTGTGAFSVGDSPNWMMATPSAGTVYRFEAWVRSETALGNAKLRVRQYLNQSHLGTVWSPSVKLGKAWQRVTIDVAALAAGATLDLQVMDTPLLSGEVFQADDVSIRMVDDTTSPLNLVGNSSFETSTTGWGGLDGATIQRVEGGHSGPYSLEVRGPAGRIAGFSVNDSPNWVVAAPAAGTVYRFEAWVRSQTALGSAKLRVRQYAGQTLLNTVWSPSVKLGPDWQKVTLDVTAATAGVTLDWQIMDAPVAPGEVFQTDDVSIVMLPGVAQIAVGPETSGMAALMTPNPLNPEAVLSFTTREPGLARVHIYSASGRHVRTLDQPATSPGRQSIRFNGMDASGRRLASGIYFYRIEAGSSRTTGRFAVVK